MNIKQVIMPSDLVFNKPKKNVCAYARVSSVKDVAHMSFDSQVETYSNYILENPEWNFIGVFADEGKSGTNTVKRTQFNQMIEMAKTGLIDLIITKSISRFARNVIDSLSILHELKTLNVEVFFEKENISSFDSKIEFVISVLSGMAEEESRNVSENVKWSVRNNFAKGNFFFQTKDFLGYDRDVDGNLIIDENQAKIVRKIFELYTTNHKTSEIVDWLNNNKIKTIRNKDKWYRSAVINIIRNEKYAGDALLQKSFRPSFKSKNKKMNNNILPKYYIEHNHIPIISKELFNKAQEIRLQRIEQFLGGNAHLYSRRSTFNKFMFCPHCNSNFQHRVSHHGTEYSKYMMQCASNRLKTTCVSEKVSLQIFDKQILSMVNTIISKQNIVIKLYESQLKKDIKRKNLLNKKQVLQDKVNELKAKILSSSDVNSFNIKVNSELQNKIISLTQSINEIENKLLMEYNYQFKVTKLRKLLSKYKEPITSIDNFPFKELFSKVIVVSRDNIRFIIGNRTDFKNVNLRKKVLFQEEITYKIRKTNYDSKFGLIYF